MLLQQLLHLLLTDTRGKIRIESLHKKVLETPYLQHSWIDSLALARERRGFMLLFQMKIGSFQLLDSPNVNLHMGLQLYDEPQSQ